MPPKRKTTTLSVLNSREFQDFKTNMQTLTTCQKAKCASTYNASIKRNMKMQQEIVKLVKDMQSGVISKEEFENKKKALLEDALDSKAAKTIVNKLGKCNLSSCYAETFKLFKSFQNFSKLLCDQASDSGQSDQVCAMFEKITSILDKVKRKKQMDIDDYIKIYELISKRA